jgi:hypothetical protein
MTDPKKKDDIEALIEALDDVPLDEEAGAEPANPTRDAAVEDGMRVARKFFERRSMGRAPNAGPLVEVHISEEVLAGMLAIAFEHGAEWAKG